MKSWKAKYEEIFKKRYFEFSFKIFHELMSKRVKDILLVSSPYDAFILEEDGRFAERIIHEYRGLNLSHPPKLTWASSPEEAFSLLKRKNFDIVITMPRFDESNPYIFCKNIKEKYPNLQVYLLAHQGNLEAVIKHVDPENDFFDRKLVWTGNSDLLLAAVKSAEDSLNAEDDTKKAKVRVIIFVEDSPKYISSILPLLYKEVVKQTQAVMEDSLNEEDRLLRMRARPKILLAESYEDAEMLYQKYQPYILGVISDIRFYKKGKLDDNAGLKLHTMIKNKTPDTPVLLLSADESNRKKAEDQQAFFHNKLSINLHSEIHSFFVNHLAFGSFVFNYPDGTKVATASNIRDMEKIIPEIPDEVIKYHAERNHISTWLTARSEIFLASLIRPVSWKDFENIDELKKFISFCIHMRRKGQQRGAIADFNSNYYDPETVFIKMGCGSLGGKARGLAFASSLLENNSELRNKFPEYTIRIPKTLVVATDYFDQFLILNQLENIFNEKLSDNEITFKFIDGKLPIDLAKNLELYLKSTNDPLAVRSSSLLEDAIYQPSAGLYKTYMIPNNHKDIKVRYKNLEKAVKLVYASTYLSEAKSLASSTLRRTEEEKMAVIIQEAIGNKYRHYFFPTISGVAQSYNFYPVSYMKPQEGVAHIAMGFGKTVVEGGKALRFSPKYPQFMPQFSKLEDILQNAQKNFFALDLKNPYSSATQDEAKFDRNLAEFNLSSIEVDYFITDIDNNSELRNMFSSYIAYDHKLVDYFSNKYYPLLTFADIIKHNSYGLPEVISELLSIVRKGMGAPIEIEFAVNYTKDEQPPEFILLQIRPMSVQLHNSDVRINKNEIKDAVCYSEMSMGNGIIDSIKDVVYVKRENFDCSKTSDIANEISKLNKTFAKERSNYLLIGPGRWGSTDKWLGIPVKWNDISMVAAIVEVSTEALNVDPSQGSHFFHNLCSLGIPYLNITNNEQDAGFINEKWINSQKPVYENEFLKHIKLKKTMKLKADGRSTKAVITH